MMFLVLTLLPWIAVAQRPDDAPLCDYYAQQEYQVNNQATQLQLVQRIVALAFGGRFNLSNYPAELTGILNAGNYSSLGQPINVNLRSWFDGSKQTTNVGGNASNVDWLDGGGTLPLARYIGGMTSEPTFNPSNSNQNTLFSRFYVSFAQLFNCSQPPNSIPDPNGNPDSTKLNVAYVHKFMDLNQIDIAHFINQLSLATLAVGFSGDDSQSLTQHLNDRYNVRCAPPITVQPGQPLQLPSLCQDYSCPRAKNPDCNAYANIIATGVASSTASVLSKGAITGIAVGGACALILLLGGAMILVQRRKKRTRPVAPPYVPPPSEYRNTMTTLGYTEATHMSEMPSPDIKKSHPLAEMDSPIQSPYLGGINGRLSGLVEMGDGEEREGRRGG